ncbi:beta-ketoacyl synthase chain length factor [Aurantibacillus circumpalustris]|uniref:beta-ketoacyl synthase chain length factor n=1 Tax=Aurantibacillus circumpalustris TaxID=3036359 RepID=UPI00295C1A1C|nr:beta-ketoacyl synthase chain length factor [Aurantibacillus circumpalustris]
MLFIHKIACISPQQTFSTVAIDALNESVENKLKVIEPSYEGIPNNILRRMGKAVKMTVGAALPLLENAKALDGIIIGTANGGMEDCIKFMNQIMEYDEGLLTPGNFVQSTPNGLAAQIGLLKKNNGYNITHVHRGLSFENAVIDAAMMLNDFPENNYLLGAADEISSYNYNVDFLGGWYKKETVSNKNLYTLDSPASIAGEGAVMCIVNSKKEGALGQLKAIHTVHSEDKQYVMQELKAFLAQHLKNESPDILISGENGDNRFLPYYEAAEKLVDKTTNILRFKHMSGEYPTASSHALWLALHILQTGSFPNHCVKRKSENRSFENILIYNNYKGAQHSFMLVSR